MPYMVIAYIRKNDNFPVEHVEQAVEIMNIRLFRSGACIWNNGPKKGRDLYEVRSYGSTSKRAQDDFEYTVRDAIDQVEVQLHHRFSSDISVGCTFK